MQAISAVTAVPVRWAERISVEVSKTGTESVLFMVFGSSCWSVTVAVTSSPYRSEKDSGSNSAMTVPP